MPCMTFRFATECEVTLDGASYEEIYLQFQDICHSSQAFDPNRALKAHNPHFKIFPPEQSTVYFEVDEQNQFNSMEIKGDFKQDILANLPTNWRERIDAKNHTKQ